MKRLTYISAIFILILGACDVLDVKPFDSIPAEIAITDSVQVESAMIGSYDALQSGGYYGLNYLVFGDLPADNLNHVGITVTWADFDNNNILADNGLVESTWAAIYNLLNRVNNIIDKVPAIDDEKLSQAGKNHVLAEARFLRALGHYDLMRLFGPIPIRNGVVTIDEASLNPPRNTIDETLQIINSDLIFAIEHLNPSLQEGRASSPAAMALKARVALHQYYITLNTSFLDEAIALATDVINIPGLILEPDYETLFSREPNSEAIFAIAFNEQDRNLIARFFAHTSIAGGRYEFKPTPAYINSFDEQDVRKDISLNMAGSFPYVVKFNDVSSGTDPVYVLRLAEMHLIRAEAAILLQGNTENIRNDINAIRERAGLSPINATSYTVLMQEVESERQKEFAFEGHRWFDLVRTGKAISILENVDNIDQTLFPIPLSEIQANDNPGMYQNNGY